MEVRSDRRYRFDVDPPALWDAISRVHEYQRWWPWLNQFDAAGFVAGDQWRCEIRPPLPYVLCFTLTLTDVEPVRSVTATAEGDIHGDATITLAPDGAGCELHLQSTLQPRRRGLRVVGQMAPWLARAGHDWVLSTGLHQFRRRAL